MKREVLYKILAAAIGSGLVLGPVIYAGETEAANSESSKEETVYIFTDASGNQQKLLVNEWLKNPENAGAILDATGLSDIVNVKGDETYDREEGDRIVWNSNGDDIYYQGSTDKEAPIEVKITYTLNGREVAPEELAGKSGRVVIRYEYKNKQTEVERVGDKTEEVFVPFTVLSGMVFSGGCAKNVEVNTGKVITEGDTVIVAGLAFPGLEESLKLDKEENLNIEIPNYVEVSMDAENFAMDLSMSLVMNDALNLLDELGLGEKEGLDDLKSDVEELKDGAKELVSGTEELADGIGELYDKVPELTDGVQELKDGIVSYTDGVAAAESGVGELKSGSGQLADGAATLADGAADLAAGTRKLKSGADTLAGGAKQLNKGAASAKKGSAQLKAGYEGENGAVAGSQALAEGAAALDTGMDSLTAGAAAASQGIEKLASGAGSVKEGADSVDSGVAGLKGGADTLKAGADTLAASAPALVRALEQVSEGLAQLKDTLEGDAEDPYGNPGQMAVLEAAVRQLEEAVCSETEGSVSLQNVTGALEADIQALKEYYFSARVDGSSLEQTVFVASEREDPQENEAEGKSASGQTDGTDFSALEKLKESTEAQKAAAREAAGQASAGLEDVTDTVDGAQAGVAEANAQVSAAGEARTSADGTYGSALDAYTPLLSDISSTLDKAGLSRYAGYVGDAESTASAIVSGYRSAADCYQSASSAYQGAASEYETVLGTYQDTVGSYDAAIASYEETIAGYEQMIGEYQKLLQDVPAGETESRAAESKAAERVSAQDEAGPEALWQKLTVDLYKLTVIQNGAEGTGGLNAGIRQLRESLFGSEEEEQDTGSMGRLTAAVDQLYEGVGTIGTQDTGTILGGMNALSAGTAQLSEGAGALSEGAGILKSGTGALAAGAAELSGGADTLAGMAPALAAGAGSIKSGSTQLAAGSTALNAGILQLAAGTEKLDGGLGTLAAGMKELSGGAGSLVSGGKTLAAGAGTLASGANTLSEGAGSLDSGVSTLQSGLEELDSNSSKLVEGAGTLAEGSGDLADGVEQLRDGSEELRDGMKKFNEEGIEKLTAFFEDDLETLADRLHAVKDAGEAYQSFAGISDGMSGNVKFIIKTESIAAE